MVVTLLDKFTNPHELIQHDYVILICAALVSVLLSLIIITLSTQHYGKKTSKHVCLLWILAIVIFATSFIALIAFMPQDHYINQIFYYPLAAISIVFIFSFATNSIGGCCVKEDDCGPLVEVVSRNVEVKT